MSELTDIQIANWRRILLLQIGPIAQFISRKEIQKLHDELQARIDKEAAALMVEES